jgi:hypothetical protein
MTETAKNILKMKAFAAKNTVKTTFFLDIDETLALEGELLPEARQGLEELKKADINVVFVTGRNRAGHRKTPDGEDVRDGAVFDVFGGYDSWLSKCPMVSGHGMEFFDGEKDNILGRSPEEQSFADFAGFQFEKFIESINKEIPQTKKMLDIGVKKHTIYANFSRLKKQDAKLGEVVAKRIEQAFDNICDGKSFDGQQIGGVSNPDKAFQTCEEVESFELRSKNWSKKKGLEASKLVEKALENGGQIIVGCNSLKPTGTDRGLVEACRDVAKKMGDVNKVKVVHVLNSNEKNRVPKGDVCEPDFVVDEVKDLGKAMSVYAKMYHQMKKTKQNLPLAIIKKSSLQR